VWAGTVWAGTESASLSSHRGPPSLHKVWGNSHDSVRSARYARAVSLPRCVCWSLPMALALVLSAFCATSSAGLGRAPVGPAVVPHTAKAAIYDLFGLNRENRQLLTTIQGHLSQEGYDVTLYRDSTEGAGGHGGATLANFVKMAKTASVIVINTHGTDFGTNSQSCSTGKGVARPQKSGVGDVVLICSRHRQEPVQQVEWYPTMEALHKAYNRYVTVGGYQKAWLYESPGDLWASTLAPPRKTDGTSKGNRSEGLRPWLGLTTSGIKHFFGGRKIDLIDNQACHSMAFAASFDAKAYLGHASTACTSFEGEDEPKLFDRMTGHENVRVRSVFDAFQLGGFTDKYFRLAVTQDIVLSPAVESSSASEGDSLSFGVPNQETLGFDAKMDTSDAASVVKISGCGGATLSGATWNGDGSQLSYAINVPKEAVGGPATLTVHARAASSDGDNAKLDGNQQPSGSQDGGSEPNGDDYVIHVICHAKTFQVLVDYAGTYTDDYAAGGFTWHETLTWHESQTYQISFTDSSITKTPGPASVTVGGTLTTAGGSPPNDNCTIAGAPGLIPPMYVSTTQEKFGPVYIASFFASVPMLTATAGNAMVQVTGTPENCIIATYNGIEPYLFNPQPYDQGATLRAAWAGSIPNVDLGALAGGPLVVPFNVDYVQGTAATGADHVVVRATATVSLTGPPTGM
jgi:hypothetical protein